MSTLYSANGMMFSINGQVLRMPDHRAPFVIQIDTSNGNGFNTFTLPLTNHVTNCVVECCDGQEKYITNYLDNTITFAQPGIYTLKIRGEAGWSFNNTGDCQKLIAINSWGDFKFNNLKYGFYGCINLGLNGGLPLTGSINATGVTDISNAFRSCNLTGLGSRDTLIRCTNITTTFATFYNNKIDSIPQGYMRTMSKLVNAVSMYSTNKITYLDVDLLDNCVVLNNINGLFQANLITFVPSIFRNISSIVDMTATFQNNLIASVADDLLHTLTNLRTLLATFEYNRFTRIKTGMFVNNVNVINYERVFNDHALGGACVIDGNIFDLSSLYKVVSWTSAFANVFYSGSLVGTMQPIWLYANPAALKSNALLNQRGLTNYNDIPNEWKGL